MIFRIFFCIWMVLMTGVSLAQLTRKEKKAARRGTPLDQPTSLSPASGSQGHAAGPKLSRKKEKSTGPTYNSQKEFEARMEARVKTNRKNEKMMMTPQYSNPAYFGHKRPPKKRAPAKMKYCKECGIRH
jgi:hypothetical protein